MKKETDERKQTQLGATSANEVCLESENLIGRNERYARAYLTFSMYAGSGYRKQCELLWRLMAKYRLQSSITIEEFMTEIEKYLKRNKRYLERETGVRYEDQQIVNAVMGSMIPRQDHDEVKTSCLTVVPGGRGGHE